MDSAKPASTLLEVLPGEIRNQIFELCISDALGRAKAPAQRIIFGTTRFSNAPQKGFKISVLPQWCGVGSIRTEGIGSLPLLFVNKQTYNEVSSLVYSKVEEVSIGPYGLQYNDEDPNVRWAYAYALLKKRPHLQRLTKNVKIYLPWLRHDLLRNYWASLGHKWQASTRQSHACTVVPGLATFLKTFQSLSSLKIILVAEVREPPNMEPLLSLYDLCGNRTTIDIVEPYFQGDTLRIATPELSHWVAAWNDCLVKNGRVDRALN
jgi:hypothetical protein